MSDLSLRVARVIAAPRATVFDAWLNPDMLRKFMMPMAEMSVPKAETNPVVGGRFDIVMHAGGNDLPHSGTYKAISPHDQIVFTWESPYSVDDSTVTLDFADADGGTKVTLTHVKFADEETRNNHEGGWTGILGALDAALSERVGSA